jgi:hypothetical protein
MNRPIEKKQGLEIWTAPADGNPLKHFMSWIKSHAPRSRFSNADDKTTLMRHMSLLDNLLMALEEGYIEGTYQDKESLLAERLEAQGLKELSSWFQDPRRHYEALSAQEKFIASVCHALLRPAERTFIDMEKVLLDPLCLKHLQQTLLLKSLERHIVVRLGVLDNWYELGLVEFSMANDKPKSRAS